MAEEHERLVSAFCSRIFRKKYKLMGKSPFVDYRPDVFAIKGNTHLFAEIEIEKTLHSDHTMEQLLTMYEYVAKRKSRNGVLVVPRNCSAKAKSLLASLFPDDCIEVEAI